MNYSVSRRQEGFEKTQYGPEIRSQLPSAKKSDPFLLDFSEGSCLCVWSQSEMREKRV